RAIATIQGFLDSARFPVPNRHPIQMNTLIQEVWALASPGIGRQRGIQVVTELSPDLPEVFADGNQLRQVLLNLVSNALDAMPEGGQVSLRTWPVSAAEGTVSIQVQISPTRGWAFHLKPCAGSSTPSSRPRGRDKARAWGLP